mmetsp:Transcript_36915/g.94420  ORF Transcript_36915/g.94420 Transcript_36915/m.94420 type:complete len:252 (-) Transcript_36915:466-1221(-)|eukprot:jgi/Tetstr1/437953/TSEL_026583.t1
MAPLSRLASPRAPAAAYTIRGRAELPLRRTPLQGQRLSLQTSSRLQRRRCLCVRSSMKSQELLDEGKALVTAGNRMGAIRAFEEALAEDPSPAQRQESLYSIMVCHASFGDVELAQITLREAIQAGLTLDDALRNDSYLPFTASKQAQIQLRKFSEIYIKSVQKAEAQAPAPATLDSATLNKSRPKKSVQELLGTRDVSGMTSTTLTGIDTSVAGIFARVAALVAFLIVFGIAAYFIGLDYVMQVPELDSN